MKKKLLRRIGIVAAAAVISVGTIGMLAACTSNHPEVTITYEFNGKTYAVEYTLSRNDAPQTVKHFIELADAGYYNYNEETGTRFVIHDFTDEYLMTGGYTIEDGELEEVDYFSVVKQLEEDLKMTFTQSVWTTVGTVSKPAKGDGLYTVYGEFEPKFIVNNGKEYRHTKGALVMYYSDKEDFSGQVTVERADGGKNNNGEPLQYEDYKLNSATSLFYTQLSAAMPSGHNQYCVFGKVKDFSVIEELLADIKEYKEGLEEDESFTVEREERLHQNESFFPQLAEMKTTAIFETPMREPIYLRSVKVNKY